MGQSLTPMDGAARDARQNYARCRSGLFPSAQAPSWPVLLPVRLRDGTGSGRWQSCHRPARSGHGKFTVAAIAIGKNKKFSAPDTLEQCGERLSDHVTGVAGPETSVKR